ncbi:MAG: histidine triad nucleotide-binding protein [Gemmatimonadales bacterium]|nr:histidine triad nucleotide-binding protein [Gemmatimonadales bacterium]
MTDCIFCRIASGEIPATVVARNDHAVAFRDLNPQAPVHILVIPTQHIASTAEVDSDSAELALGRTIRLAVQVAKAEGLDDGGYRLVINTGRDGGQSVWHVHVHLLAGRRLGWPPG